MRASVYHANNPTKSLQLSSKSSSGLIALGVLAVLCGGPIRAVAQQCPPNAHFTRSTQEGNVRTVHCECNDGYERQGNQCVRSGGNYVPSGNGFVGGTSWIVGYNVQNADPALIARSQEMLRQQMELAGIPYNAAIDFKRYNFVIGIAASTDIFTDLRKRVLFDELKNGRFSRETQIAYDSLKGRQFNELGCHSNGAMICLAAIENNDLKVDRVTLYGPQITAESLQMWNELVRSGQVKSVQIYLNRNDPVPPVAMLAASRSPIAAGQNLALFKADTLVRTINETAPRLAVRSFDCGRGILTLSCHDMARYKANSGCVSRSSGRPVPGTALPGRGSLTEPPPPC